MIELAPGVHVAEGELRFSATRSGGPGGQHVNKTATRVTLRLDVAGSPSLTEGQRRAILERHRARIRGGGELIVVAQGTRSQTANKEAALRRLRELVRVALVPKILRVPTGVPAAERRRRTDAKQARSRLKRTRSGRTSSDED